MAVRLFVGNLPYGTTESDLRTYFGAVAPPAQIVLPVDRDTGRPRGFAFVEFVERTDAEKAIQRFNGQAFNGRPLAVSEARAREDRGPAPPRPAFGARPASPFISRPFEPGAAPAPARSRNFGPDAKPHRAGAKVKKREDRPKGPIPVKSGGRSFTLDDDSPDEVVPDLDDIATSKPKEEEEKETEDSLHRDRRPTTGGHPTTGVPGWARAAGRPRAGAQPSGLPIRMRRSGRTAGEPQPLRLALGGLDFDTDPLSQPRDRLRMPRHKGLPFRFAERDGDDTFPLKGGQHTGQGTRPGDPRNIE